MNKKLNLLELKNKSKITLVDAINQAEKNFDRLDAQQLMAYINSICSDLKTCKKWINKTLSTSALYDINKMEDYLQVKFNVSDHDLIQLLKRNGIDINDFGFEFNFIEEAHRQYTPAIDPEILNPLTDNDLLIRYKDYFPEFVLDPYIFKGGFNILGAERGTGKTRFCLSLAYHIIFGRKNFLGCPLNCDGDVLYINMENPEKDFKFFIEPHKAPFLRESPELYNTTRN